MAVLRIFDGLIYDGSLNDPVRGDVWVKDDRIIAVGEGAPALTPDETIDALELECMKKEYTFDKAADLILRYLCSLDEKKRI